jgi:hypothetical protein
MPLVTLNFDNPINVSCQVGDTAYYVTTSTSEKAGHEGDGFTINSSDIVEIGTIVEITQQSGSSTFLDRIIVYSTIAGWAGNVTNRFILFSKDNKANLSSPLGYYASVKMVNNDTAAAELFNVTTDSFASST